jgi:hypothetical protein
MLVKIKDNLFVAHGLLKLLDKFSENTVETINKSFDSFTIYW